MQYSLTSSTIFAKYLVAITGLILVGFIFGHLAANLLVLLGPTLGRDLLNAYGHGLRQTPLLLWGARITLLIAVIIHIYFTSKLTMINKIAKPKSYKVNNTRKANFASKNMILFGFVLIAFILYHLMHYTLMITHPEYASLIDDQGRHDVYTMVVFGFRNPIVSVSYIIAMISLGLHLRHGIQSMFQTIGISGNDLSKKIILISNIVSIIVTILFSLIPISILLGIVGV